MSLNLGSSFDLSQFLSEINEKECLLQKQPLDFSFQIPENICNDLKNDSFQETINEKNEIIHDLNKKLKYNEDEINELQKNFKKTREINDFIVSENAILKEQIILLKKEFFSDTKNNELMSNINTKKSENLIKCENFNEHLMGASEIEENDKLKQKCEELLQKNKRKNSLLNRLKAENTEIKSKLEMKSKEMLELEQRTPPLFELKQNEINTQPKIQEIISKYKSRIRVLEQELLNQKNAFQQQINNRIQTYNALLERNEENELEYKEIRFELHNKKKIISSLEEKIKEIQQETESYKSQAVSSEESMILFSKDNEKLQKLLESEISLRERQTEEKEILIKNEKKMGEEIEVLRKELQKEQEKNTLSEGKQKELEKELMELKEKSKELENNFLTTTKKTEDEQKNNKFLGKKNKNNDSSKQAAQNKKNLNQEIETLKNNLRQREKNHNKTIQLLEASQKKNEEYLNKISELEENEKKMVNQIDRLKEEKVHLLKTLDQQKTKFESDIQTLIGQIQKNLLRKLPSDDSVNQFFLTNKLDIALQEK